MPHKVEELTGTHAYTRFVFGKPPDQTIVGELESGESIKGRTSEDSLKCGVAYRFYGFWSAYRGKSQFVFQSFVEALPLGKRGTILYLQRCKGIGGKRAADIWEAFGADCLQILKEQPEKVAQEIKGLTPESATTVAEQLRRTEALEGATVELMDLLGGRGFPLSVTRELLERFGNEAASKIRDDPYCLMGFKFCGFLRVDRLYLELGKDPMAIERQMWCVWYCLHSNSEGHTWQPIGDAKAFLTKNVAGVDPNHIGFHEVIGYGIDAGHLAKCEVDGAEWIALAAKAEQEASVADSIHAAEVWQGPLAWPDPESLDCSEHQKGEIAKAFGGIVGILGGRPGTGKTYAMARAIKALAGRRVAVCAPTGKAAVRSTEAMAESGIQTTATTIHTLLGVVANADNGWSFTHNATNPLEFDFVFVDEASMISTDLMASLLDARPDGCHVLLVGDPGQLSPIGHGAPLRDLIRAGLPAGLLTEIQRNSGRIVKTCKGIAEAGKFEASPALDLAAGENLVWVHQSTADAQKQSLIDFLDRVAARGEYDVLRDCQVMVPVNDKSPLARKALNKMLQGHLNPNSEQAKGNPFRKNDKVICLKNGRRPIHPTPPDDDDDEGDGKCYVANGEIGYVLDVSHKWFTVHLDAPERQIIVLRGTDGEEGDAGCDWDLAYAISTHKSQGSEWPIVVVLFDAYGGAVRLVDKHWTYTAISRAKTLCVCIGPKRIADDACKKSHMFHRKTLLVETIERLRLHGLAAAWENELNDLMEV